PALARLDYHRQIRRERAVVGCASRLVVREGAGDRVGGPGRALEHLALIVRLLVGDLISRGDRLHLVLAVPDIRQVTEIKMLDGVACGTDLLVDLKAALLR